MSEVERVDAAQAQLQAQADQTVAAIRALAGKFQAAQAQSHPSMQEWKLDLREIAMALQAEQRQVAALVQALHDFVVDNAHQALVEASYEAPPQQQQPQYQPEEQQPARGRGLLARFMGGRFGSAVAQGAGLGLGFGLAEDVIDDIF
jgi:hypothetical protein